MKSWYVTSTIKRESKLLVLCQQTLNSTVPNYTLLGVLSAKLFPWVPGSHSKSTKVPLHVQTLVLWQATPSLFFLLLPSSSPTGSVFVLTQETRKRKTQKVACGGGYVYHKYSFSFVKQSNDHHQVYYLFLSEMKRQAILVILMAFLIKVSSAE